MARLIEWDQIGERIYETGLDRGVLYPQSGGAYPKGVPWNGLIGITENPTGAEPTPFYADNIKYLNLMSVEEFGAGIEAYTYPEEFEKCDGSASLADGVTIGQQDRSTFGLSYRTRIGNDQDSELGYKLHLVYGAVASPSDKDRQTINETPEALTFSWDITTTPVPVNVEGLKPTSKVTIDSTKVDSAQLEALEKILYGEKKESPAADVPGRLPLPDEIATIFPQG